MTNAADMIRGLSRSVIRISIAEELERDLSIADNLTREASEMLVAALEIEDIADRLDTIDEATDMAERAREILRRWA